MIRREGTPKIIVRNNCPQAIIVFSSPPTAEFKFPCVLVFSAKKTRDLDRAITRRAHSSRTCLFAQLHTYIIHSSVRISVRVKYSSRFIGLSDRPARFPCRNRVPPKPRDPVPQRPSPPPEYRSVPVQQETFYLIRARGQDERVLNPADIRSRLTLIISIEFAVRACNAKFVSSSRVLATNVYIYI